MNSKTKRRLFSSCDIQEELVNISRECPVEKIGKEYVQKYRKNSIEVFEEDNDGFLSTEEIKRVWAMAPENVRAFFAS